MSVILYQSHNQEIGALRPQTPCRRTKENEVHVREPRTLTALCAAKDLRAFIGSKVSFTPSLSIRRHITSHFFRLSAQQSISYVQGGADDVCLPYLQYI